MQSGMEKDDNYSATTVTIEAEANRDNGSRSFQIQDNLDYSSMCHSKPSSSYDDDAMKVAAANIDGHNHNDIHDGSGGVVMVDYMHNDASLNNMIIPSYQQQQQLSNPEPNNGNMIAVERTLSFADVMQFAEFGAKLALNHNHIIHLPQQHQLQDQEVSSHALNSTSYGSGIDPVSFLKFPVLTNQLFMSSGRDNPNIIQNNNDNNSNGGTAIALKEMRGVEFDYNPEQEEGGDAEYIYAQSTTGTNNVTSHLYNNPVQLEFLGHATTNTSDENFIDNINGDKTVTERGEQGGVAADGKSSSSKRKRPRTIKTSEEVESQRMTHIAVERNRRKQMNEHLRVLRSLMPSSYVQRGDQASIIGGAIEFVRELEQLLQCLESQKRRRLYGDQQSRPMGDSTSTLALAQQPPLSFPTCPPPLLTNLEVAPNNHHHHHHHHEENDDQLRHVGNHHDHHGVDNSSTAVGGGLLIQEETAESKSSIADVEVKVVGFDTLIKILSRRRPGQLIKAIAALEDLQFTILHTNITTIEQTVLYSFNVKVGNEARFTAEDIASSVQQIFTFIHGNTNLI